MCIYPERWKKKTTVVPTRGDRCHSRRATVFAVFWALSLGCEDWCLVGQYGEWSLRSRRQPPDFHQCSAGSSTWLASDRLPFGGRVSKYRGMLTGMLRRRVGLQVVRAFARQRLRRVGLVGIPRTEIDGWRERQQRDRTLGSRGSDALVRLSDVLAYAAEYRAHTPHGVMP